LIGEACRPMSSLTTLLAGDHRERMRNISSGERLLMYGIEKWPSNTDDHWQRKMNEARSAAVHGGLDAQLVRTAARFGICRLVRTTDRFQSEMYRKIRAFVFEHELKISEVIDEIQYRIAAVKLEFDLTEEIVAASVVEGLMHYVEDGGSPEVAIRLADAMAIAEGARSFLQPAVIVMD